MNNIFQPTTNNLFGPPTYQQQGTYPIAQQTGWMGTSQRSYSPIQSQTSKSNYGSYRGQQRVIRLDYMPSTQGDGIAYSTNIGSQSEYKGISILMVRLEDYYMIRTQKIEQRHQIIITNACNSGKFNHTLIGNKQSIVQPQFPTQNSWNPPNSNHYSKDTYNNAPNLFKQDNSVLNPQKSPYFNQNSQTQNIFGQTTASTNIFQMPGPSYPSNQQPTNNLNIFSQQNQGPNLFAQPGFQNNAPLNTSQNQPFQTSNLFQQPTQQQPVNIFGQQPMAQSTNIFQNGMTQPGNIFQQQPTQNIFAQTHQQAPFNNLFSTQSNNYQQPYLNNQIFQQSYPTFNNSLNLQNPYSNPLINQQYNQLLFNRMNDPTFQLRLLFQSDPNQATQMITSFKDQMQNLLSVISESEQIMLEKQQQDELNYYQELKQRFIQESEQDQARQALYEDAIKFKNSVKHSQPNWTAPCDSYSRMSQSSLVYRQSESLKPSIMRPVSLMSSQIRPQTANLSRVSVKLKPIKIQVHFLESDQQFELTFYIKQNLADSRAVKDALIKDLVDQKVIPTKQYGDYVRESEYDEENGVLQLKQTKKVIWTRRNYDIKPDMKQLSCMDENALRNISHLEISNQYGSLTWQDVDILYLNLDYLVEISREYINVYPDDFSAQYNQYLKPEQGKKLNTRCEIKLKILSKKLRDLPEDQIKDFFMKKNDQVQRNTINIERDYQGDLWIHFVVEHFTKYGLDVDDVQSDMEEEEEENNHFRVNGNLRQVQTQFGEPSEDEEDIYSDEKETRKVSSESFERERSRRIQEGKDRLASLQMRQRQPQPDNSNQGCIERVIKLNRRLFGSTFVNLKANLTLIKLPIFVSGSRQSFDMASIYFQEAREKHQYNRVSEKLFTVLKSSVDCNIGRINLINILFGNPKFNFGSEAVKGSDRFVALNLTEQEKLRITEMALFSKIDQFSQLRKPLLELKHQGVPFYCERTLHEIQKIQDPLFNSLMFEIFLTMHLKLDLRSQVIEALERSFGDLEFLLVLIEILVQSSYFMEKLKIIPSHVKRWKIVVRNILSKSNVDTKMLGAVVDSFWVLYSEKEREKIKRALSTNQKASPNFQGTQGNQLSGLITNLRYEEAHEQAEQEGLQKDYELISVNYTIPLLIIGEYKLDTKDGKQMLNSVVQKLHRMGLQNNEVVMNAELYLNGKKEFVHFSPQNIYQYRMLEKLRLISK